jgi:glycosyltransferase involved in cell wall biosynthesis
VLSVIIPARNEERTLPRALQALAQEPVHEVIVVDDGSSDATAEVAGAVGATVVSLPGRGRAAARNRGAAAADAKLFAFLDADCVPKAGWAEALTGCLARTPLVGGAVHLETTANPSAVERFDVLWRFKQERAVVEGGWSASANLAMTREAFERLGGFDEQLHTGHDVDLCIRARHADLAIGWCPGAQVTHPASRTLREVRQRATRQGFSSTTLARRFDGEIGRRHWRHPGGIVRGRAALRALGVEPDALDPAERRRMAMLARFDYAGRFAGSLWAEVARPAVK